MAIEEGSNLTSGELTRLFDISDETVRFRLHRLDKIYKLSECVPHMFLKSRRDSEWLPLCRGFFATILIYIQPSAY